MLKVYVDCRSPLIKRSIEIFLRNFISDRENCQAIISDGYTNTEKPLLTVGNKESDAIKSPFTKSSLMLALDKLHKSLEDKKPNKPNIDLQIEKLTQNFAHELANLLKAKYEH